MIDKHTGQERQDNTAAVLVLSRAYLLNIRKQTGALEMYFSGSDPITMQLGSGHPDCFIMDGAHPRMVKIAKFWLSLDKKHRKEQMKKN